MRVTIVHGNVKLEREIAGIGDLSRDGLVARWVSIYGCPPPAGVRQQLLRHAAAWNLQAKRLGGLSTQTRRAIAVMADRLDTQAFVRDRNDGASPARERIGQGNSPVGKVTNPLDMSVTSNPVIRSKPQPGTRLIREWNGKANVVDVMDGTFLYEGLEYASLSAIARKITGAHWSGPRFFGL